MFWTKKIDDNVNKILTGGLPEKNIYHYTDINGLRGILQSDCIWLTSSDYTNDRRELHDGRDLFRKAIEKKFCLNGGHNRVTEKIIEGIEKEHVPHTYIASFSRSKNSLSQWRAYGKNGSGYMLTIDPQELRSSYFAYGEDGAPSTRLLLQSVVYDKREKKGVA